MFYQPQSSYLTILSVKVPQICIRLSVINHPKMIYSCYIFDWITGMNGVKLSTMTGPIHDTTANQSYCNCRSLVLAVFAFHDKCTAMQVAQAKSDKILIVKGHSKNNSQEHFCLFLSAPISLSLSLDLSCLFAAHHSNLQAQTCSS